MDADAVEKLRLVRAHDASQASDFNRLAVLHIMAARHLLAYRHALQHHSHVFQSRSGAQAVIAQGVRYVKHRLAIAHSQRLDEPEYIAAIHRAEHGAHIRFLQRARAKCNRLVGERERIAHGAACAAREQS